MPAYLLKSYYKGCSILLANQDLIFVKFHYLKKSPKIVIILYCLSLSVNL